MATSDSSRPVAPAVPPPSAPRRLYKFRSLDERARPWTRSIFSDGSLWFARASTFNDPFDCNHTIRLDNNTEQWVAAAARLQQRLGEAAFGLVGSLLGYFVGKVADAMVARGGLKKKPAIDAKAGEALGRRFGAHSTLSFGGRPIADIARGTIRDATGRERPAAEVLNELYHEAVEKARRDIDARFGVFSLSAVPDDILLWSHYAQDHRGIAIEFDTESHTAAFPSLLPVVYQDERPIITQAFGNLLVNLSDAPSSEMAAELLTRLQTRDLSASWAMKDVHAWFLTKSTSWGYEREWRAIKEGPGAHRIPPDAISGVIVGCVDSDATLSLVREWVQGRRRKVALYRAVRRDDAFALDIEPIEETRAAAKPRRTASESPRATPRPLRAPSRTRPSTRRSRTARSVSKRR